MPSCGVAIIVSEQTAELFTRFDVVFPLILAELDRIA